ncbi:Tec1 protein [Martiniozyma asiatica (nom. inval.)]|nr:Tec1 protein [Martiniozyma asiatica]
MSNINIKENVCADRAKNLLAIERKKLFDDSKRNLNDSKWPYAIETAFREALSIIPKQGLKKNKVDGVSLGRNQYISMYVKEKTGVERTAKQISSHIQTVAQAKKDSHLINLIKYGAKVKPETEDIFLNTFSNIMSKNKYLSSDSKRHESNILGYESLAYDKIIKLMNIPYKLEFSSPSKVISIIEKKNLTERSIGKFPNLLKYLKEIHLTKKMMVNQNIPVVSLPVIYGSTFVSLSSQTKFNKLEASIELSFPRSMSSLKLGIYTIIYSNGVEQEKYFEKLFTYPISFEEKICTLDVGAHYWEHLLNEIKNFKAISNVSIEQYLIKTSEDVNYNEDSYQIDSREIQSIFIWDFANILHSSKPRTKTKICILNGINDDRYDIFDENILMKTETETETERIKSPLLCIDPLSVSYDNYQIVNDASIEELLPNDFSARPKNMPTFITDSCYPTSSTQTSLSKLVENEPTSFVNTLVDEALAQNYGVENYGKQGLINFIFDANIKSPNLVADNPIIETQKAQSQLFKNEARELTEANIDIFGIQNAFYDYEATSFINEWS